MGVTVRELMRDPLRSFIYTARVWGDASAWGHSLTRQRYGKGCVRGARLGGAQHRIGEG